MSDGWQIPLAEPLLGGNASAYLQECLATNFVSSVGPFVDRFERAFAEYVGARFAVACASGTAAIHLALRLLDVSGGDEVFVPTLTFIASANPIHYQRAVPVLVDSEAATWNLDPERVITELHRRAKAGLKLPKAVEVVHLLGHPAAIDALAEVCEQYEVAWFEDAAEALGARYVAGRHAGRHVGTVGRIGCFSFNGNKVITTGGGGMLVTDDEALAKRARHLSTQARMPGLAYDHDEVGYNYRLTNLAAALGLAQMEQLETLLTAKRRIADHYDHALKAVPGLELPPRAPWAESSCWLYTLLAPRSRDGLLADLMAAGIQARPLWTPLHTLKPYRSAPRLGGEVAERVFARAVSLPSSAGLTAEDQEAVIQVCRRERR